MINEGNSLAELQAKVLLASRHEKKSATLWQERSPLSLTELFKRSEKVWNLQYLTFPVHQNSFIAQLRKQPSPLPKLRLKPSYVRKDGAIVTYVGTSRLVARLDDMI